MPRVRLCHPLSSESKPIFITREDPLREGGSSPPETPSVERRGAKCEYTNALKGFGCVSQPGESAKCKPKRDG